MRERRVKDQAKKRKARKIRGQFMKASYPRIELGTVNFVPEKGWRPHQAHICIVFNELYANLHLILRGSRKLALYFMSFT